MCDQLMNKSFFMTSNGSVVWITKGKGDQYNGLIIKATEATRRRFPVGTKVVYQNDMGHVMCKGEDEEGKECVLHPLDAVNFWGWPDDEPTFAKLTKKVQEKFTGREVLKVTAKSPKAVQKKPKSAPVVGEVHLKFKDLKAGQKYKYTHSEAVYERNGVRLSKTPGPDNRTVNMGGGITGWETPDTEVILVA